MLCLSSYLEIMGGRRGGHRPHVQRGRAPRKQEQREAQAGVAPSNVLTPENSPQVC